MRLRHSIISEVSRLTVYKETKGLSLEFKYLMQGIHCIFNNNNLNISLFGIKKEHYKLYSRLGGIKVLEELNSYGSFTVPCLIVSWDLSQVSPFFKKAFLGQK